MLVLITYFKCIIYKLNCNKTRNMDLTIFKLICVLKILNVEISLYTHLPDYSFGGKYFFLFMYQETFFSRTDKSHVLIRSHCQGTRFLQPGHWHSPEWSRWAEQTCLKPGPCPGLPRVSPHLSSRFPGLRPFATRYRRKHDGTGHLSERRKERVNCAPPLKRKKNNNKNIRSVTLKPAMIWNKEIHWIVYCVCVCLCIVCTTKPRYFFDFTFIKRLLTIRDASKSSMSLSFISFSSLFVARVKEPFASTSQAVDKDSLLVSCYSIKEHSKHYFEFPNVNQYF